MLNKCRPFLTRTLSRVMVEERQKGGDALGGQQMVVTSNGRLISSHCQTAVHESAHGTFETCRRTLRMSAFRARPEVIGACQNDEIDPTTATPKKLSSTILI